MSLVYACLTSFMIIQGVCDAGILIWVPKKIDINSKEHKIDYFHYKLCTELFFLKPFEVCSYIKGRGKEGGGANHPYLQLVCEDADQHGRVEGIFKAPQAVVHESIGVDFTEG